jgi:hypothetical protein
MRRREFIVLLGAAVIMRPDDGVSQSSPKTYRLASLTGNAPISANSANVKTSPTTHAGLGAILSKFRSSLMI